MSGSRRVSFQLPGSRVAAYEAQTTGSETITVASIAIGQNSGQMISVDFYAVASDFSKSMCGFFTAPFIRQSGNVSRSTPGTGSGAILSDMVGDFAPAPNVNIAANTSSQSADVRVTGIAGTTISWSVAVQTLPSPPP